METSSIVLQRGILRIELFRIWRSESNVLEKCECVLRFVKEKSNFNSLQTHFQNKIVKTLKNFCGQLNKKWIKCHRNENFFKEKNKLWLKGKIQFSVFSLPSTSGRPTKSFVASSESVKRRKVSSLVQNTSPEELTFATRMSLRSEGRRDAAEIVKQVTLYSPQRVTNIKRRYVASQQTQMSNDEALALFIDTKLTKMQYKTIRNNAKMHKANIYPSYDQLLLAKKACYPENITVTEISAEVQLQYLVDHTIKRLIQVQSEVLVNLDFTDLSILFKWGCDGAAGQSRYKQRFSNEDYVDSFLFSVSLVPLRLIAKTSNEEQIVWQNPSTSSTRFCRPIKIIFTKETKDRVKNEVERVQTQINSLVPYQVEFNGKQITCSSLFSLTMIDGKICSWLSDISSQCCHLCGATPKLMHDLAAMKVRPVNEDNLSFGISSLHAWINTLECILHIGYRLDIKKWRITKTDKEILQVRKKQIQDRFKNELGLLIDLPKPGFGSTNDGNTARRVLHNATLTSQITGVDENLIKKLNIILITISCGFEIDADIFENYCMETAELYVTKYPWYYMPQSLHKVLIHGKKLINHAILPIGQMSEEAQESRNKDSKQFREFHSRRFSRRETMEDMMHMLLISSDPVITSLRRKVQKKKLPFPEAVLRMLKCPPVSSNTVESDDDD